MRMSVVVFSVLLGLVGSAALANDRAPALDANSYLQQLESFRVAQARTCKAVSTCEEAVRLWCGGYRRADGDNDGIPCENVCSSRAQVDEIREEIGC